MLRSFMWIETRTPHVGPSMYLRLTSSGPSSSRTVIVPQELWRSTSVASALRTSPTPANSTSSVALLSPPLAAAKISSVQS